MNAVPGYWMNETSGMLVQVVNRYLYGEELTPIEVRMMRAYFRQWIAADFRGPGIRELRRDIEGIATTEDVRAWLDKAMSAGIDPL